MIEEYFEQLAGRIRHSYTKSKFSRIGDRFFSWVTSFPPLRYVGSRDIPTKYFHPLIFVVLFLVFLGLSDSPMSSYGTMTVFLGLGAFILGTMVRFREIRLPEKLFYPLVIAFFACVALISVDWSIFSKLGLIPFTLIYFSQKRYSFEIYLISFIVFILLFFRVGYWAITVPYVFVSLVFMARSLQYNEQYHMEKLKHSLLLFAFLLPFSQYPSIVPFILTFWIFLFIYYLITLVIVGSDGTLHDIITGNLWTLTVLLIGIGTLYWALDLLAYGGIPLLQPLGRGTLNPWYTMAAHLLPLGTILLVSLTGIELENTRARCVSLVFVTVALLTMAALGYRTQIALIVLGVLIAAGFTTLVTLEEITVLGGLGAVGLIAMTALRNIILETTISVIDAVRYRIGLTLTSYDILADLGGIKGFTHGFVHMASYPPLANLMPGIAYSPRRYIGVIVGAENVSITSTIMGPLVIDFGILGVVAGMFFLGYLLSKTHRLIGKTDGREKALFIGLYAVLLGYTITGIETGLVDFEVLLVFFLSFLYVLYRG